MAGDELEFVEWLRDRCGQHAAVKLGVGDDMAVVGLPTGRVLISCDMLLDGVHFDMRKHTPRQIGRKAIACGLSDCAAMAVRPVAATVSVSLPVDLALSAAKELYCGVLALADEYDVAIAGGDTTRWGSPLAIDVAIVATPYAGIEPVTRSGARPGDTLFVTGRLGGSLLGRHMIFTPRVREARALAEQLGDRLHAMLDISDGLALDLWRMCRASNVGATLSEPLLESVISDDARQAEADDDKTALDHALSDGEDFELLLAVTRERAKPTLASGGASESDADSRAWHPVVPLYPVGQVTDGVLTIRRADGRVEPLEPRGYVH